MVTRGCRPVGGVWGGGDFFFWVACAMMGACGVVRK
jgi:hypothetical protein